VTTESQLQLAGCIILDKTGRILLLHRNTAKRQQWEIPGGKIEKGEEAATAAVREVKEELGVAVSINKFLGEKAFTEDNFTMHYYWYIADINSGKVRIMETQTFDDLKYFSSADLEATYDALSPNTQNLYKFLQENPRGIV